MLKKSDQRRSRFAPSSRETWGVKRETRVSSGAAALPAEQRVLALRGWAGGKSGLFEHPAWCTPVIPDVQTSEISAYPQSFSAACESHSLKPENGQGVDLKL